MQRKTGARGLRTILENVLLDTMYELPSMKNVAKVVVDEPVIDGRDEAVRGLRVGRARRASRAPTTPLTRARVRSEH